MRSILFRNVKNIQAAKISEWYGWRYAGTWPTRARSATSPATPRPAPASSTCSAGIATTGILRYFPRQVALTREADDQGGVRAGLHHPHRAAVRVQVRGVPGPRAPLRRQLRVLLRLAGRVQLATVPRRHRDVLLVLLRLQVLQERHHRRKAYEAGLPHTLL